MVEQLDSPLSIIQSRPFLTMALLVLLTIIRCRWGLTTLQVAMDSVYERKVQSLFFVLLLKFLSLIGTIFINLPSVMTVTVMTMTAVPRRMVVHRPQSIRINQRHHYRLLKKPITILNDVYLISRWCPTGHLYTTPIQHWMNLFRYHHHLRMAIPIGKNLIEPPSNILFTTTIAEPEVELTSTSIPGRDVENADASGWDSGYPQPLRFVPIA